MRIKARKAFTLVELIVILAVLAILAAAGVGTAVGYMKRSKFNQNQENAVTIYQTAQTALSQKEKSGVLESWVTDKLLTYGSESPYNSGNPSSNITSESRFVSRTEFDNFTPAAGASVHTRYALTYIPGAGDDQSKLVDDLIRSYFYDTTIFQGTITIEFDVVKSFDSDLNPHYSANCYSAFVSAENKEGWGGTSLPVRAWDYREETSHIGYYDASDSSLTNNVYLPVEDVIEMDFFDLTTYADGTDNKLDISWSASMGEGSALGRNKHIHYVINFLVPPQTGYDPENICEIVLVEDMLLNNQFSGANMLELLASSSDGSSIVIGSTSYPVSTSSLQRDVIVGEETVSAIYTETYFTATARVYVASGSDVGQYDSRVAEGTYIEVPIKVSYIKDDIDTLGNKLSPYMMYTITLDQTSIQALFSPSVHPNVMANITAMPNNFTVAGYEDYNASGSVTASGTLDFGTINISGLATGG
ncbi:MAG: prepilin-type N-terminal cleavage/methylation domain-containing protein [Saccharofermentans sp.]|nr:prepilin-type N-terminal cleavage/methylation domain-containing protein [Saccharofermentans sp.]